MVVDDRTLFLVYLDRTVAFVAGDSCDVRHSAIAQETLLAIYACVQPPLG